MDSRTSRDRLRHVPPLVVAGVVVLVCIVQALPLLFPSVGFLGLSSRLEWITYDLRVKYAAAHRQTPASCLGVVYIDDESLATFNQKDYRYSWPWPRWLHGRLVEELRSLGVRAVGFDILFRERQPLDYRTALPPAYFAEWTRSEWGMATNLVGAEEVLVDGTNRFLGSDGYFAVQLRRASNVVVGAMGQVVEHEGSPKWDPVEPHPLFATNAWAVGHIMGDADADGVLRRARAFYDDRTSGRRFWQLGLVLAARFLDLDLEHARVLPGRLEIPGRRGPGRVIPIDQDGAFYIDWCLEWNDSAITRASFEDVVLAQPQDRKKWRASWRGKLVLVGSLGIGNNVSDRGATPLWPWTYLVSQHWNVANSIIQDRFIRRSGYGTEAALIVLMGVFSGIVTWRFRVLWASLLLFALMFGYVSLAFALYTYSRYWLPLVLPVVGALLTTHVCLVTFRVVVEQQERTRVRSIFAKVVSPGVVAELLQSENLALGGTRRKVSVFFADIRGFTSLTDDAHAGAEAYVKEHGLCEGEAEEHLESQAREVLATVNLYLGVVADTILQFNGTFDKYIGDCAMAFWGAPTPDERHAVHCVRAAVEAQRRIYGLNAERAAENERRQRENEQRASRGELPLPPLKLLALGSGINTGVVTVGLMGSDKHTVNYTVFGREVNLASRLEGISGRGRILISESTHQELERLDPKVAEACLALPPVTVKGFREPVRVYEVQWRQLGDGPIGYDTAIVTGGGPTDFKTSREAPSA